MRFSTSSLVCQKMIDLASSAIIANDFEAFIVHVENQILALDGCNKRTRITNTINTMTAKPMRPISPLERIGLGR